MNLRFDEVPWHCKKTTYQPNLLSLTDKENLSKILLKVPRDFEICTKDGSCYFNTHIIRDISETISKLLDQRSDANCYDISLNNNIVLKKIEELCQGKSIELYENELSEYKNIVNILQIYNLPKYFSNTKKIQLKYGCKDFLQNIPITFIISTKKDEYCCNIFGICSSKVIFDFITNNPDINQYIYDYDDEFKEFQQICNFFNFEQISITSNNLSFLKKIAEDLQIDSILEKINTIIQFQEIIDQKIDENQKTADKIKDLFELLYKINELSVVTVKNSIYKSKWSRNEENVKELAAFILQVIGSDYRLHENIMKLLIQLDSEYHDEMKILIPLIKDKLMESLDQKQNQCAFIYRLYQKGIISKKEMFSKIQEFIQNQKDDDDYYNSDKTEPYFALWFLPEIIEFGCFNEIHIDITIKSFLEETYLPDKIDLYKKTRDSFLPDDEITRALMFDDIDTFLSIISKKQIKDISRCYVPYNIFDFGNINTLNTIGNSEKKMSYINYAAAFGSVKCFKYLLLNHSNISKATFYYSIYGGNDEIIKIIDNQLDNIILIDNRNSFDFFKISKFLFTLIEMHRYDLFDWVLEQKITNYESVLDNLKDIITHSISNGNVHALISLIDKGIYIKNILDICSGKLQSIAAFKGFYHLLKFLYNIDDSEKKVDSNNFETNNSNYASFGNLNIFKFFIKTRKKEQSIIPLLSNAFELNEMKMIHYFFEDQTHTITYGMLNVSILKALKKKSDELFYILIDKFNRYFPNVLESSNLNYWIDIDLLKTACKYGQTKPFYTIINLFEKNNQINDFNDCLFNAASSNSMEICKYIIDHKYKVDYKSIFDRIVHSTNIDYDIISFLYNSSGLEFDKSLFLPIFQRAIMNKCKNLVLFILEKKLFYDKMLIDAVETNDFDIVDMILKYKSTPNFINRLIERTALHVAVEKNNLKIVKRLLSLSSINPYLYDNKDHTPLMIAASKLYFPIINELLPFYGKNVILHRESIDFLFESLIQKNDIDDDQPENFMINLKNIFEMILNFENIEMIIDKKNQHFFDELFPFQDIDIHTVQLSLEKNIIDVNKILNEHNETPLTLAIKAKRIDLVKLYINDPKLNVNIKNSMTETALHLAVLQNNLEIVQMLLSVPSIDPYIYDDDKKTPLMIAAAEFNLPIINEIVLFSSTNNKIHKDSFFFLIKQLTGKYHVKKQKYNYDEYDDYDNHDENDNDEQSINEENKKILKMIEMVLNIKDIQLIFTDEYSIPLTYFCEISDIDIKFIQTCLKAGAIDVNYCSSKMQDNLLIKAVKDQKIDLIKLYINYPKTDINSLNYSNKSALIIACMEGQLEIVKLLLSVPSIDPDFEDEDKINLFSMMYDDMNFLIINEFISSYAKNIFLHQKSIGFFLGALLKELSNIKYYWEKDDKIDPKQQEMDKNIMDSVENILKIENIQMILDNKLQKNFIFIFENKNMDIKYIQKILKFIDVNIVASYNGNTPLISSLVIKRPDIAELLINDPRTDVNKINSKDETALIIAVEKQLVSIVRLLVDNANFDPDESNIEYAFIIANDEIAEILISKNSFDINCQIIGNCEFASYNETALINAAKNQYLSKFELIIKHPKFDLRKSNFQKAIAIIFGIKEKSILLDFIKILNRNELIYNCFQFIELFYSLIDSDNFEILDEIMNGKTYNYEISDQFIKKLFHHCLIVSDQSIKYMTFLIDYDQKHNNVIDFKNESFLTHIKKYNKCDSIEEIVNFIIDKGDDVNRPNEENAYPLQQAILSEFEELVDVLLKTQKINYCQIINIQLNNYVSAETYLHLAARMDSLKIFEMLLNFNVFDINARNSDCETPLMVACRHNHQKHVELLFKKDSLDFSCKNDINEDALKIAKKLIYNGDDDDDDDEQDENISKESYLSRLKMIFHEHNRRIYDYYDFD